MLSAGREPSGAPGVGRHVAERASKGDLGDELQFPLSPQGIVTVECGQEGGRVISKVHSEAT